MKRIVLPLVVVLVLGVLGFAGWLALRSGDSGATGPDAAAALSPGDAVALEGAKSGDSALATPAADRSGAERTSAEIAAARAKSGGPVLWVDVRAPEGCETDEFVEVFGLRRESDLDALQTTLGARRVGDDERDLASAFLLARAAVDAEGRAKLEFPLATKQAHVMLAGRSWFTRDTIAVDLRVANPRLVLQAECGGWIAARAALPDGASAGGTENETASLRVSLASMGMGMGGGGRRGGGMGGMFQRGERRARVAGGAFEFWALDPTLGYTVDYVPERFAAAQVEVPEIARGRATPVTVTLQAGGSIAGRVTDESGAGVAGAEVEARVAGVMFGFDDRTVRRAQTDAEGRYTLAAVLPGTVQVAARGPAHVASESRAVEVLDRGTATNVDFALTTGATVSGLVVWPDGTPAVGAEVTANAERGGAGGGAGGFDMRAMRQAVRRGEDPKATTDAQGRFTVRGLAEGKVTLAAELLKPADAATHANSSNDVKRKLAWRARATGVATNTTDAKLTLGEPLTVRGNVTSAADGTPVVEFAVRAQLQGGGGGRGGGGPFGGAAAPTAGSRVNEDVNDARGEFVLGGLREGRWRVTVTADGFAASDAVEVELPLAAEAKPLTFALVRAGSIQGLVSAPRGGGVPGASVGAPANAGGMFGGGGGGRGGGNAADELPRVRTDGNGAFAIEGLKAGRYTLVAESKQWARSEEVTVEVTAGAVTQGVTIAMRDGGRVTGELYDEGRPAAGRTINALDTRTFASASARTDASGRFVLEHLLAGTWTITALPSMEALGRVDPASDGNPMRMLSSMKSVSVDVVEGQDTHVVLGAAPAAPVAVRGKVTQGGAPVAGVRVTFLGEGQSFGPGMKTATTGDDGTYAIQLDKAGDYSISVQANGGRMSMLEFVETVPQRADVVIDLPLPTARISGRVLTPAGEPAVGVSVTLQPTKQVVGGSMLGGGFSAVQTDADGAFDLSSLRAGSYTLSIGGQGFGGFRGPGGGGGGGAVYGKKTVPDLKLAEGEWRRDVDVRLETASAVVVEVVDERGEKVTGASVFARDESGRAVDRMSTVRTDANGAGRYGGLSSGRYTFSARKDGLATGESAKVEVREGQEPRVRVTLTAGTTLVVTTVDSNDAAVRAEVRVLDEGGRDVAGLMSAQDLMGRFARGGPGTNQQKIGPLAPGKYKVIATAADGREIEKSVTLSGTAERAMTLAFAN